MKDFNEFESQIVQILNIWGELNLKSKKLGKVQSTPYSIFGNWKQKRKEHLTVTQTNGYEFENERTESENAERTLDLVKRYEFESVFSQECLHFN